MSANRSAAVTEASLYALIFFIWMSSALWAVVAHIDSEPSLCRVNASSVLHTFTV